jgi:NAD(P)-dependent dehydrogenase (short-subunit alcohol dehydrogenase family)
MNRVLVTGANRGIGLEICRKLAGRGDEVIAVCRRSSNELAELGVRVLDNIDVSDGASVARLAAALEGVKIDILVNNAGILLRDNFGELDYDDMMRQYQVNTLGPLRVTEALLPNLSSGAKVAIVSSRVGSIEDNGSGGYYGYRASKTAVNQVATNLKHELLPKGIAVAILHPGLVATGMTGGQGISAADSAAGLVDRIDDLTLENSGGFWHAEGYSLPW